MTIGESASWIGIVMAPLAVVGSGALRHVPQWIGGLLTSTCAAAFIRRKPQSHVEAALETEPDAASIDGEEPETPEAAEPFAAGDDAQSLVAEMLSRGRYALLLRPRLIGNLSANQLAKARTALSEGMCLVPAGPVLVQHNAGIPDADAPSETSLWCDGYYLDRYQVTNAQYYQFVKHGGYEQMAIWDPEVLPAVLDFVDRTGHPGPRFWRDGRYSRGEDHHPVVGVCWYEAAAYARWVGKRLPTDAEWVKAASWPVAIAGHPLLQRRYPWGEAVDRTRANLWGSGPGRTVRVDEFPAGVSVGGAQQLIGNVWEWTADPLVLPARDEPSAATVEMKTLRGGAFDTYLDNQATCQYQSGDDALARKHNIGFRTAISLCDFAQFGTGDGSAQPESTEPPLVENPS